MVFEVFVGQGVEENLAHTPPGGEGVVLEKVPDACAASGGARSAIRFLGTRENLEKRGLSRAVGANEPDLFARANFERKPRKQRPPATVGFR